MDITLDLLIDVVSNVQAQADAVLGYDQAGAAAIGAAVGLIGGPVGAAIGGLVGYGVARHDTNDILQNISDTLKGLRELRPKADSQPNLVIVLVEYGKGDRYILPYGVLALGTTDHPVQL